MTCLLTLPTNATLRVFSTHHKSTEALCWNANPLFVLKQSDRTAVVSVPAVLRVSFKTENSSSQTTDRWAMPPLTPPLPPQFVHPTLWDRSVRQRHNTAFISSLILTHTHTHTCTLCLHHRDNSCTKQQETVKDIFPIVRLWFDSLCFASLCFQTYSF